MSAKVEPFVGKSVKRREDPPLVQGKGRYMDDIRIPGMLHMAVIRSPLAHARILRINAQKAINHPGVRAVITGADLWPEIKPLPVFWKLPGQKEDSIPILAVDKVRYVGEAVAIVVADSRYIAEDASELVEVDYDPLEAVVDPLKSMAPGAPVINEAWGDNIAISLPMGTGDVGAAFAAADHIVREKFHYNRYTGVPLEGRGCVAQWDEVTETLIVWSGSQVATLLRTQLASSLGIPEHSIRVMTPNIGGGFGVKWDAYPEDVLTCLAARQLGAPVKWTEDRVEHFQSTVHGRDQWHEWEMALDKNGTVLGLRGRLVTDLGAHLHSAGIGPSWLTGAAMPGQYRITAYQCQVVVVATNKVPSGTLRGFGGPEATFAMERLMDTAARELKLDPAEIRMRNYIQPDQFVWQSAGGGYYDSGNYPGALKKALAMVGYEQFRQEQAHLRKQGIYRGIGIASYIHAAGFGPSLVLGLLGYQTSGYEGARVRVDPSGKITLFTSMIPIGQGTETTLAQVTADQFGVDISDVKVVWGDTSSVPYTGFGSAGSRCNVAAAAIIKASAEVIGKMKQIAAHSLQVAPDEVELKSGVFVLGSEGDQRTLSIAQVAKQSYLAHNLPPGVQPTLEGNYVYDPANFTWAYGTHIAVVDVEIQTGRTKVLRYICVDDCGPQINPMLVEGQIHGGVVQGLGGAMLEDLVYDEQGQLLTSTFMHYLLPTASDVPRIEVAHLETPSPHSPGGFKGAGEAGIMSPAPAVANAVSDALAHLGVKVNDLPVSPQRLWRLIEEASREK